MTKDSESNGKAGRAQLRADLPTETAAEQDAVRTTIVGGRPPGSGKPVGRVPRGIEVLLKKAAVDAEFRELLLHKPEQAAESIGLELQPVERAMLLGMPREQLAVIINQTNVPQQQRRAFLGTAAAAMIAVLTGTALTGCREGQTKGSQPDLPSPVTGIAPDDPALQSPEIEFPKGETGSRPFDPSEDLHETRPEWADGSSPDLPSNLLPPESD